MQDNNNRKGVEISLDRNHTLKEAFGKLLYKRWHTIAVFTVLLVIARIIKVEPTGLQIVTELLITLAISVAISAYLHIVYDTVLDNLSEYFTRTR